MGGSSRAIRAARAFVEVYLDSSKIKAGLKKMRATLTAAGAGLRKLGAFGLAGGAAIAGGLGLAIKAGSNLQETMNKFDTVFAKPTAGAAEFGDAAADAAAKARNELSKFSDIPTPGFGDFDLPPVPTPEIGDVELPDIPSPTVGDFDLPPVPTPEIGDVKLPDIPSPTVGDVELPDVPTLEIDDVKLPPGVREYGDAAAAAAAKAKAGYSDLSNIPSPKFDDVKLPSADIESVTKWGDEFGRVVGRSKNQVRSFLAESQDLFVPIGFDNDSAASLSKAVTGLAVDLASFNNMADADTLRDLKAAVTGSGEVMKKYGVIVSEAAVKQELLNSGFDPKTANNQQKVMARLNLIFRGTTAAQGDAVRSANSWANQQKRLGALLEDTAAIVGGVLLPIVTPLLKTVGDYVAIAGDWIQQNPGLVKGLAAVAVGVVGVSAALFAAGVILPGIGAGLGLIVSAAGAVAAAVGFLLSPMGLLIALAVAGAAAWIKWGNGGAVAADFLRNTFGRLSEDAQTSFGAIKDALAAGEWKLAGQILWLALKQEWIRGTSVIMKKWNEFRSGFLGTLDGMLTAARKKWASWQNLIAQGLVKLNGLVDSSIDTDAVLKNLDEDFQRKLQGIDDGAERRQTERDSKTERDLEAAAKQVEAIRRQWADVVEAAKNKREEHDNNIAAGQDDADDQLDDTTGSIADQMKAVSDALKSGGVNQKVNAAAGPAGADIRSTAGADLLVGVSNNSQQQVARDTLAEIRQNGGRLTTLVSLNRGAKKPARVVSIRG